VLLEGLEISEVKYSYACSNNDIFRIDSNYFQKEFLREESVITARGGQTLQKLGVQLRSFGAYSLNNSVDYLDAGVPFIRGVNMKKGRVNFDDLIYISEEAHSLLWKSEITPETVLLSMSGTVGDVALASKTWEYPINSNQDIAKINTKGQLNPYALYAFLLSRFGQNYLKREARGSVQQHVFLSQIEQFKVPILSKHLEGAIQKAVVASEASQGKAIALLDLAERTLIDALGLGKGIAPEPLSYVRNSLDAFTTGRLDAEYFAPRVSELLKRLGRDKLCIADLAPPRRQRFKPDREGRFDYIEIGGLRTDGTVEAEQLLQREAPSRATQIVTSGDVITSTVRPIRRLSALIAPEQNGFVCSSGFVVLQPVKIAPEVLLTYLRLKPVCELMDLHTSASLYPAISEQDVLALPIPSIDQETQKIVTAAVQAAQQSRQRATQLLEAAKRAVEIAIENSESAASAYLAEVDQ
jgi:restriction endonuclease S subunit